VLLSWLALLGRVTPSEDIGQSTTAETLPDYGVPVFTDDVASSNYSVFKGPATFGLSLSARRTAAVADDDPQAASV
jgi:hypothetical protein